MEILVQLQEKKVKNETFIKPSKCEAFIVKEILIFISYYFKSHLRIRINHIPRHDDYGEMPSNENLSLFFHPR